LIIVVAVSIVVVKKIRQRRKAKATEAQLEELEDSAYSQTPKERTTSKKEGANFQRKSDAVPRLEGIIIGEKIGEGNFGEVRTGDCKQKTRNEIQVFFLFLTKEMDLLKKREWHSCCTEGSERVFQRV
jgi:hypothetical protein